MRKIIFSSALIISILFLNSCATIFGGRITACQKIKPAAGEPHRKIRAGALIADIYFGNIICPIPIAIDFLTKAIYKPCDDGIIINRTHITPDSTIANSKWLSVSICPTEMVSGFETMYLDYKFSKHFSLGIGAGHIFPWGHAIIGGDEPVWLAYNGTIVRANAKYFFNDKGFYIGMLGIYKNLYYSWQNFSNYDKIDDSYCTFTKSETSSLFGANILFGHENRISKHIDLEFFIGAGIDFRNRDYTIHSVIDHYYGLNNKPVPGHFTESNMLFSMPIGIKIGFIHAKK